MKKRFKHKQTGKVAEKFVTSQYCINMDTEREEILPAWVVENSSDWEEIKDEYTILSLIEILNNSQKGVILIAKQEIKAYLKNIKGNPGWGIHSIRRESDGEVFTINDNTQYGIITKFETSEESIKRTGSPWLGGLGVWFEDGHTKVTIQDVIKVKPKEYEITAFRGKIDSSVIYYLNKNKYISNNGANSLATLKEMLRAVSSNLVEIYSVKRLSDGVEFKIGDKIKYQACPPHSIIQTPIIDRLFICEKTNDILMNGKILHINCCYSLKDIQHYKQPLFTTEDGVDIYEENFTVYSVGKPNSLAVPWNVEKWDNCKECHVKNSTTYFFFSTKEKAEEYIINNKPCLSLKDLENYEIPAKNWKKIINLVKERLKL